MTHEIKTGNLNFSTGPLNKARIIYLLTAISLVTSTFYLIYFLKFSLTLAAFLNFAAMLLYGLTFIFVHRWNLRYAKMWLFTVYIMHVTLLAWIALPKAAEFHCFLFTVPPSIFLSSEYRHSIDKFGFSAIAIVLFLVTETMDINYFNGALSESRIQILFISMMIGIQLCIVFVVYLFTFDINKYEIERSHHIEELTGALKEIKQLSDDILYSDNVFRTIFEQAGVGVTLTCTQTGKLLQVNKKYSEIVGYSVEELSNIKNFQQLTHPNDLELDLKNLNALREGKIDAYSMEKRYIRPDSSEIWVVLSVTPISEERKQHIGIIQDITDRKLLEAEVKSLQGIIPICANCKKIRDDKGYWKQIESYLREHSEAEFTHGICPECTKELYPNFKRQS